MSFDEEAADALLASAGTSPELAREISEAREMHELISLSGWKILIQRMQRQSLTFMDGIARRLMAGDVVDQREIDFQRGFLACARKLAKEPEQTTKNLELAARQAYLISQSRETQGEPSPYLD